MNNDKNKGSKGGAMSAPLDSSRSGEDFIGDTTGLTGVTTGSAQKTSATPNDTQKDENKDHLPGGIITTPNIKQETGGRLPTEIDNEEEYAKHTLQNMSPTKAAEANDLASESDDTSSDDQNIPNRAHVQEDTEPYQVNKQDASGDDAPGVGYHNTSSATFSQDDNLGEQSVSGSTPDPTADDDTLANAQAVGTQLHEDDEHPQELDIARDIDKAENDLKTH